jgi:hypothetical protein
MSENGERSVFHECSFCKGRDMTERTVLSEPVGGVGRSGMTSTKIQGNTSQNTIICVVTHTS